MPPTAPTKETKAEEWGAWPAVSGAPVLAPPAPQPRALTCRGQRPGVQKPQPQLRIFSIPERPAPRRRARLPSNQSESSNRGSLYGLGRILTNGNFKHAGVSPPYSFRNPMGNKSRGVPRPGAMPQTNRRRRLRGGAANCGAELSPSLDGGLAGSALDSLSHAWLCGCLGAALACAGISAPAGCCVPVFRAAALRARKTGTGECQLQHLRGWG